MWISPCRPAFQCWPIETLPTGLWRPAESIPDLPNHEYQWAHLIGSLYQVPFFCFSTTSSSSFKEKKKKKTRGLFRHTGYSDSVRFFFPGSQRERRERESLYFFFLTEQTGFSSSSSSSSSFTRSSSFFLSFLPVSRCVLYNSRLVARLNTK